MTLTNLSKKRTVFIMIGVMLSILLAALDSTIVGPAMPKIVGDLKGMEHYAWPFTAYMLCSTVVIPIFGKLADIYGRKPIYFIGITIFLVGSALCGASQTMIQLILFRGLQGIGGGILMSNVFAIVGDIFSPAERGKYMGFVVSMFGLASIIGPLTGGFITDNLTWRWIFYVNIPLGIAAIAIMTVSFPHFKGEVVNRIFDYAGMTTLIIAIVPMLLAFSWAGRDYAWSSPLIIGMFVFSVIMITLFIFIEKKAKEPIIPLTLFKNSIFNVSSIAGFLTNALMFGAVMFIPLFVQLVLGSSATSSGMITTPMMLSLVIASIIVGIIISKTGKYKVLAVTGFILSVIGSILLSLINAKSHQAVVTIDMIVLGLGIGINMPILNITVQNAFPHSQLGIVTSSMQFFRNIGGTISTAVFGSVLLSNMQSGISRIDLSKVTDMRIKEFFSNTQALTNVEAVAAARKGIEAAVTSKKAPEIALKGFDALMNQVKDIIANSVHHVFVITVIIAIIGFVVILFLKEIPLAKNNDSKGKSELIENT